MKGRKANAKAEPGPHKRPMPPREIVEALFGMRFAPAPDVAEWIRAAILADDGPLFNEEHAHLRDAEIGVLWASSGYVKRGRRVLGMAEVPMFQCHPWQKARQQQQLAEWFGAIAKLDFLITLDAFHCSQCDDADFCALIEHELYHCGQAKDEFGVPKFGKDGRPVFSMRSHDIEEFVGVVRRYGIGHPDGPMAELVRAVAAGPSVGASSIASACGCCLAKA